MKSVKTFLKVTYSSILNFRADLKEDFSPISRVVVENCFSLVF